MTDFDAETRDALRDLCEAVATLGALTVHEIGTGAASAVIEKASRLSHRMDELDALDTAIPSPGGPQ